MRPNTASASVFPDMCGIPQSSRVMVTFAASRDQRAMSLADGDCNCAPVVEASDAQRRKSVLKDFVMGGIVTRSLPSFPLFRQTSWITPRVALPSQNQREIGGW